MMARKHWQIVRHTEEGRPVEGAAKTLPIAGRRARSSMPPCGRRG